MVSASTLFLVFGLLGLLLGGVAYAVALGKFRKHLKQADPLLYSTLGFDEGMLFATGHGTREAQLFFFHKKFFEHPNTQIQKSGNSVYITIIGVAVSMALFVFGMLLHAFAS